MQFDRYSDSYDQKLEESLAGLPGESKVFIAAKIELLSKTLRAHFKSPPSALTALDFGCGIGNLDAEMSGWFRRLIGVDVSEKSLEVARSRNSFADYRPMTGAEIPVETASVDFCLAVNVFHHIQVGDRPAAMKEIRRVLKPDGVLVVIEHNPINPLTRLVVSRCEYDADAVLLAPGEVVRHGKGAGLVPVDRGYILFFPWQARALSMIERHLSWLPMGAQYFVALKPIAGES